MSTDNAVVLCPSCARHLGEPHQEVTAADGPTPHCWYCGVEIRQRLPDDEMATALRQIWVETERFRLRLERTMVWAFGSFAVMFILAAAALLALDDVGSATIYGLGALMLTLMWRVTYRNYRNIKTGLDEGPPF